MKFYIIELIKGIHETGTYKVGDFIGATSEAIVGVIVIIGLINLVLLIKKGLKEKEKEKKYETY